MAVAFEAARPSRGTRVAVVLLVAAAVGTAALLAGESALGSSTLLGPPTPELFVLLALVTSVGVVAGAVAGSQGRDRACLGLAVACTASSLPLWGLSRWTAEPIAVACLCAAPLVVPGLLITAQGWGGSSPQRDRARTVAEVTAVAASLILLLGYDPFRDVACLFPCRHANPPWSGLAAASTTYGVASALVVIASYAAVVALLRGSTTIPALLLWPATGALSLAGLTSMLVAISPESVAWRTAQVWSWPVGFLAVGVCALVAGARAHRVRQRLAMLTARVEEPGLSPAESALRDVRLQFAVPGSTAWVDRDGRAASAAPSGFVVVLLDEDGPAVRLVGSTGMDLQDAVDALGPLERMALGSARESALTRAHAREVAESQRRIVALTDRERHRIEADLHDGAQQRLVSVKLHLALAASRHPEAVRQLAAAEAEVQSALSALRDIAHGQVPRILETDGLAVALEDLAAASSVPVELVGVHGRNNPDTDSAVAVYSAVVAVLHQGDPASTDAVVVAVERRGARLVAHIDVPWVLQQTPETVVAADRFGALGGSLTATGDGVRTFLKGELSCG